MPPPPSSVRVVRPVSTGASLGSGRLPTGSGPGHHEGEGGGIYVLYLSVFFLLLAFFILLTSLSDFKRPKADAIIAGLQGAFGETGGDTDTGPDAARRGEAMMRMSALATSVAREIPGGLLTPPTAHGATLSVTVPLDDLFERDEAGALRVSSRWGGLVTRLADALREGQGGTADASPAPHPLQHWPLRLEFLVGDGGSDGEGTIIGAITPVAAAGAVARALAASGAPVAALTVGVERAAAGRGRFIFSLMGGEGASESPAAPGRIGDGGRP